MVKEDSCGGCPVDAVPLHQYARMGSALNATGRPVVFSLCAPGELGPDATALPVAKQIGNMWRIGPDNTGWIPILQNIDLNEPLRQYAGPGRFNDPDLLISRASDGTQWITERQVRAQFSMWAVMASPLLISGTLLRISATTLETYTNAGIIAINQDSAGEQGWRVAGPPVTDPNWVKFPFVGPAAAVRPCARGILPRQNWTFNVSGGPGWGERLRNGGGNCTNVAPQNPVCNSGYTPTYHKCANGLLHVEQYCGAGRSPTQNGTWDDLAFRLESDGILRSNLDGRFGLCASLTANGWVAMNSCDSSSPTPPPARWQHDTHTGQLRTQFGPDTVCLDWGERTLVPPNATNVWARRLVDGVGGHAVVFLNVGLSSTNISCSASCFAAMGYARGQVLLAHDVWLGRDLPPIVNSSFIARRVPGDGGVRVLRVWRPNNPNNQ